MARMARWVEAGPERDIESCCHITGGNNMPITTFSSVDDGLDANRRNRGHFITNIDVDDERLWVPYAEGVWFQPCCFNVTAGGFSVLLKGLPGAKLGVHYHVGTVRSYTMRGHWRYLEHDWVAKPERSSTNPRVKLIRWSSPTIRLSRPRLYSWSKLA